MVKAATEASSQYLIKMIDKNARRIQERVRELADAVKGVTSPTRFAPCQIFAGLVATVKETLAYLAKEKRHFTLHQRARRPADHSSR